MLDVKRLQVLLRVVETGSVSAAADELFYTPSAVSQQLRKLEEEVGQPLLRRRSRGMVPTDAGHVLAGHARTILHQMDAAMADLAQLASVGGGSLNLGTFPTLGGSFLPLVISRFRSQYPAIKLNVTSSRLDGLLELLARGELGLSLLWEYAWNPLDPKKFDLLPVFEEPTVLLVGAEHALAQRGEVSMAELGAEQWIVRAHNHPVGEVLQRSANAAGFSPRISFQANDYQEAQAMVSVGLGIALAPLSAVVIKHPGVQVLRLGDSAPSRRVLLAQRHDRVRAPAEVAFQALLLRVAEEWEHDFVLPADTEAGQAQQ
ncbi:LysR family transcriptional regulator [Paeniglutamicibacter psychrophenolicus]|uniref:LysR family transcriptional regulator n=1 Tax=Paeniglutamicibacter psychrophenolicus TaxID=257454 RepID=UPI0027894CF8|nr:LysR family transcriptional regulator [Paeniglutamicibacter psychrophenolicus]MDQ0093107.1 DNA-binding transcriptional LysR family regulator [Paeniglutamicibacter psychrophenolicus]